VRSGFGEIGSVRVSSTERAFMMRPWVPLKIHRRPDGGEVLFTQHVDTRKLRKEPFPVLVKFPDISRDDLPVYRENPKYLEYYSHGHDGRVARRSQLGDVVHLDGIRFGECIGEHAGARARPIQVEPRGGGREHYAARDLFVVHHNIEGMADDDREGLLDECLRSYRTLEELKFAERLRHEKTLDWVLGHRGDLAVDVPLIRKLHGKLMEGLFDWAGEYRTRELVVGSENFSTTPPRFIDVEMTQFGDDLKRWSQQLDRLTEGERSFWVVLARIYLELCRIHPFRDGNGRVSRLLLTVLLVKKADRPAPLDWSVLKRATSKTDWAFCKAREEEELTPLAGLVYRVYRKSGCELGFDVPRWRELGADKSCRQPREDD
jgi:fido (protein-threonine AMPylation protein)